VTLDYGADYPRARPNIPKPLRVTFVNTGKSTKEVLAVGKLKINRPW
jgi:hypothetical protein